MEEVNFDLNYAVVEFAEKPARVTWKPTLGNGYYDFTLGGVFVPFNPIRKIKSIKRKK